MKKVYSLTILGFLLLTVIQGQTQEIQLSPTKDNTIYNEGSLSNGAGERIFAGVTKNGDKRRALIKFDLADAVPEGVEVDRAQLILYPSQVKTNGTIATLHMLTADWGEGSSNAEGEEGKGAQADDGDATWIMTFLGGKPWGRPGGDFDTEILASSAVFIEEDATFESADLTALVNTWILDPGSNHGVIVLGEEPKISTALRFNSREHADSETRPRLKLFYEGATSINNKEFAAHDFRVYPDPSSSDLWIHNSYEAHKGTIKLYSITGALVYSGEFYLQTGENVINTKLEDKGIYLYHLLTEKGSLTGKILR